MTLTFLVGPSESSAYSRSHCFRFRADGTLRGGDNFIAATRVNGCWRVGHRLYRDFECGGPVFLMIWKTASAKAIGYGPCNMVKAVGGQLFADDVGLGIYLPTCEASAVDSWHEALLLPAARAC